MLDNSAFYVSPIGVCMQFIDLKTQYKRIKGLIQTNINEVLEHGQFILGPEVKQLEHQLADYAQVKHALAVGNGTIAIQVALMALELKPGDEVITTPFTFIATVSMLLLMGLKPVFVDIDPKTFNIDASKIEEKITSKTKAIMPVDLYGQCADYDAINQIAKKHNLYVLEDAAQSYGAKQNDVKVGNLATITSTSFYPAKPLGAYGEGGACFTNDDELAIKMRKIHNHGQEGLYNHLCLGVNARLDSLQAAILLAKLTIYNDELTARQLIAKKYDELLKDVVITPYILPKNYSIYAIYTIQVHDRDAVRKHLTEKCIPTAIHYPKPVYLQPGFLNLGYKNGDFPVCEKVSAHVLSLPMHPYLTDEQLKFITDEIKIAC